MTRLDNDVPEPRLTRFDWLTAVCLVWMAALACFLIYVVTA
jgi:hypothetical protein